MADDTKLTTRAAIEKVLKGSRKPMTVAQICDAALPLTNIKGATPKQQFYSLLYSENKRPDGLVTQVERGTFKLNLKRKSAKAKVAA
jgi:hypothetical protein